MKLRDLDIMHKRGTQSPQFIAAQIAALLNTSIPEEFIDEVSITNLLESGEAPSQIVKSLTQKTHSHA